MSRFLSEFGLMDCWIVCNSNFTSCKTGVIICLNYDLYDFIDEYDFIVAGEVLLYMAKLLSEFGLMD